MLVKSKVKYIQSLSLKKQRDEDGVFVAEGPKIINELLAAGTVELQELYVLAGTTSLNLNVDIPIINVAEHELQKISFLSTPNQVLGVFKKPLKRSPKSSKGITLMLDGIQDPGNMGTIIRCADWFGVEQVICSMTCADIYAPKTVQSTMGSVASVNARYEDLTEAINSLAGIETYAATLQGTSIYETEMPETCIIVIGNESKGVSDEVLSLIKKRITIPRKGFAESLNAAVATGIILSHLVK